MVTFSFFFPEVKIFVALEQRNFSLLTYVNALNREIEALDKQNRQLKDLLLGDLKGYLKGYLWILGICANWLVFGFAHVQVWMEDKQNCRNNWPTSKKLKLTA